MKKKLSVTLALALFFCLIFTGCSNTNMNNLTGMMSDDSTPLSTSKAAVRYHDEWHYYDSCAQAWATANAWNEDDCTFMLLTDWVADSNGSFDDNGGYGENGFGFYKNMLNPRDRGDDGGDKNSWLTIDLNGYTIDKNLYSAGDSHNWSDPVKDNRKENGRIFYFDNIDSNLNVWIKNGTLRGANTEDEGGAIWIDDEDVNLTLDHLTITDNCAEDNGGAIWIDICDSLTLKNVNIQYNYCTDDATKVAAAYLDDGDFYFYDTVIINMNYASTLKDKEEGQNNLALGDWLESAAVASGSSIHLTDVTTAHFRLVNGFLGLKTAGGYRRITREKRDDEYSHDFFTLSAFHLDYELTNRGYFEITLPDQYGKAGGECKHWVVHWE